MNEEFWKDAPNFKGYYRVSTHGRVVNVSGYRPTELKGTIRKNGYRWVVLSKDGVQTQKAVHRLVLETFLPIKEAKHGLHRDGVRINNRLENLYWGTPKENYEDSRRHGTNYSGEKAAEKVRGEKSPTAKLKDFHIQEIRKIYSAGITQRRIGELYGVDATTIKAILKGQTWKHI